MDGDSDDDGRDELMMGTRIMRRRMIRMKLME